MLAGLVAGALLPPALIALAGDVLPVRPGFALHRTPLVDQRRLRPAVAFMFVLPPLARARRFPVATLFRAGLEDRTWIDRRSLRLPPPRRLSWWRWRSAPRAIRCSPPRCSARSRRCSLILLGIGFGGARDGAKRCRACAGRWSGSPSPRSTAPARRPSALVIALGLALTLFVTLAAIQTSLAAEIARSVPERAPNQFVLDIPATERGRFERLVAGARAGGRDQRRAQSCAARSSPMAAQRVAELQELPEGAWFLRGERGVTYSRHPAGRQRSRRRALVAGRLCRPPLVSLDARGGARDGRRASATR